jgi:uncharacterized protein (DUF58 family)
MPKSPQSQIRPASSKTDRMHIRGGAYTDIRELIRLRHASKELELPTSNRALNPMSGLLTSKFRGRGIDFAEVRAYQPGDDIRTIDWRVTARTQIPHTKLFQEEKERPVLILVDQSHSMFFGSKIVFKSVVAAEAAAVIAWTALDRGDRVGGIVFSETLHREVRPRRNKHSVLRLLNEVNDFNKRLGKEFDGNPGNYLTEALRNVRRVAKHGSAIFIISDFANFNDEAQLHLGQLARHNDIVGIHVSDQLERELPRPDFYTITDGKSRARINTASKKNRDAYQQGFCENLAVVKSEFLKHKAILLELQTEQMIGDALLKAIGRSAREISGK